MIVSGAQGQLTFESASPASEWNTRYVAYARSLGRTPDEQIEIDRTSVSCMTNYMLWNGSMWREWATEVGRRHLDFLSNEEHVAFDAWLAVRVP